MIIENTHIKIRGFLVIKEMSYPVVESLNCPSGKIIRLKGENLISTICDIECVIIEYYDISWRIQSRLLYARRYITYTSNGNNDASQKCCDDTYKEKFIDNN